MFEKKPQKSKKKQPSKVYHIEVVTSVKTSFVNGEPVTNVKKIVVKNVGEVEMSQFIGETTSMKNGQVVKTPKIGYFKQLGFKSAVCINVTDIDGEQVKTTEKDIERINKLLSPPHIKTQAESIEEKAAAILEQNEALQARIDVLEAANAGDQPDKPEGDDKGTGKEESK